jgi:hypothetical protein
MTTKQTTKPATKPKRVIDSLTDEQLETLCRALGVTDEEIAGEPVIAQAYYRDEHTLGWPNWPGSKDFLKWKPQVNASKEQRVLLLKACYKLLTGEELPELKSMESAEIVVSFDFGPGYSWPEVSLKGR